MQSLALCTFILLPEMTKSVKKGGYILAKSAPFSCSPSSLDRDELDFEQDTFQLLFLHPKNQTVEAWETNCIELDDLINHLKAGESVFINPKKHKREKFSKYLDKKMKSPPYFKHI